MSTAALAARIVPPSAIGGKPHQQVVEQDLDAVLRRQPRKPIGPRPLAQVASAAGPEPKG